MISKKLACAAVAVALFIFSSSAAMAATKVTLMYTASAPYAAAFVAKDQGFFKNHGVDVDLKLAQNGSVIIAGIVSGSAQVGIPTPTVAFQAVDNGIKLKAFASTNVFPDTSQAGLVVSPKSGIKDPKDLEGKKIGVPGIGGLLDVVMRQWVAANGGDPTKINIVEVALPQTADMLRSGQVDGVATVDPFLSRAVKTGAGKLIGNYLSVITPGTSGGIFVATKAWADAHMKAIRGMQAALDEAVAYIKTHDKSARKSLAKYTTLPPKVVAGLKWPNFATHLSPEKSFKFWNTLALKQHLISKPVDLKSFTITYLGD